MYGLNNKDVIMFDSNLPSIASLNACPIKASSRFIAYRATNGSAIGLVPLEAKGKSESYLIQESSAVNDLDWYGHSILGVGTNSGINLYNYKGDKEVNALTSLPLPSPVENLLFHPVAKGILLASAADSIKLWDFESEKSILDLSKSKPIKSISFKSDGSLLSCTTSDNSLYGVDTRSGTDAIVIDKCHVGVKPATTTWCGNLNLILTCGFDATRNREFAIWDIKMTGKPLYRTSIDSSQGVINAMYDADTNLIFLGGKGDTRLNFLEFTPEKPPVLLPKPILTQNIISGCCLVPKTGLKVMEGEVDRILTIQQQNIIPISARVPRKSYFEFHEDLFPLTIPEEREIDASAWLNGTVQMPTLVSLKPSAKPKVAEPPTLKPAVELQPTISPRNSTATPSKINLPTYSPYRHVQTELKSVVDDLKTGNPPLSNESNAFEVNDKFFAFPVIGTGGRLAVLSSSFQGRAPAKLSCIVNGADMNDFKFDPFDDNVLATACDDAKVRLYQIPANGLSDDFITPESILSGHLDRITLLQFHPTIKGMLLSASPNDGTVKLWDTKNATCVLTIQIGEAPLAASFDLLGRYVAVITKDGTLSIYDLKTGQLTKKTSSHKGAKSARLFWLKGGQGLVSVGFGIASQREIIVYDLNNFEVPNVTIIDTSSSFLLPYYDYDTGVLLLIGRGESTIQYYEIIDRKPQFLNKFQISSGISIGFSTLSKLAVDVEKVEIIKGYRMSQSILEYVSVTVPRIKKQFFQDDVFPDTIEFKSSHIDIAAWQSGSKVTLKTQSLRPPHLIPVSQAPVEESKVAPRPTFQEVMSEEAKKQEAMQKMFEKASMQTNDVLEQDKMEGVAEDEWD